MARTKKNSTTAAEADSKINPPETVLVLRTSDRDRKSWGGFQWPESGRVEAKDWKATTECGNGLHGLLGGLGDFAHLKMGEDETVQVVEVQRDHCIDLSGKVKFPFCELKFSGKWSGAWKLMIPAMQAEIRREVDKLKESLTTQTPAATSGNYAPAATSGYKAPAATSGNYAPAATSGNYAPAATSGDYAPAATSGYKAPAATSGNYAPAATSGNYAPAATSGYKAPAATSGNYAPAATSGYKAPAATSGNYAPAATSGNYAPAATSGDYAPAATSGNYAPAATSGNYAPAATSGNYAPAATSGNYAPAATSGYKAPAATSGKHSVAAAIGLEAIAKAGETGAIMLAAYRTDWAKEQPHELAAVFAGMVGQTYGGVTIQPDTFYRLTVEGALEVAD